MKKRIELAKNDIQAQQYLDEYISGLELEIESLKKEKELHMKDMKYDCLENDTLQLIRERLRQFIMNIKQEAPDIQHSMLKNYLSMVAADLVSGNFKLQYFIEVDGQSLEGKYSKVLEKSIYFKL